MALEMGILLICLTVFSIMIKYNMDDALQLRALL